MDGEERAEKFDSPPTSTLEGWNPNHWTIEAGYIYQISLLKYILFHLVSAGLIFQGKITELGTISPVSTLMGF